MRQRIVFVWGCLTVALVLANLGYTLFTGDWSPAWLRTPMGISGAAHLVYAWYTGHQRYLAARAEHKQRYDQIAKRIEGMRNGSHHDHI